MMVLISPKPVSHPWFIPIVVVFLLGLSLLMVSNLPYRSFKDINLGKRRPVPVLFLIAVVFALITVKPRTVLSIMAIVYILSAPCFVLSKTLRSSRKENPDEPDPSG